jgi:hypothetical protein
MLAALAITGETAPRFNPAKICFTQNVAESF